MKEAKEPEWVDVNRVVEVIERSRHNEWVWMLNANCKYIELRIDMRDGECRIMDRYGKEITLAELQRQDQRPRRGGEEDA